MAAADRVSLCISNGESLFHRVTYRTGSPLMPVDLTGFNIEIEFRPNIDADVLLTASTGNGMVVIDPDPTTGIFTIDIDPTTIQTNIGEEGSFCYRVDAISSGGRVKRLFGGNFRITRE